MNVLILTPDRVGSTLLQRVLTIYMINKGFDKPVINLHELTNGLSLYHSQTFDQEMLKKDFSIGYAQSLTEIEALLGVADHYKTSRLAHYHLVNRNDPIADQLKFYNYLNENFYIIGCRRENLLEHALSWGIHAHSKKLNVYSFSEKIANFQDIYESKITIPRESLINYLNKYKKYIEWSDTYFNVQTYFQYDTDVHNLESFVQSLNFMKRGMHKWEDTFGQSFANFNACHKLIPDLVLHKDINKGEEKFKLIDSTMASQYNIFKGADWPAYADLTGVDVVSSEIQNEIATISSVNKIVGPVDVSISKTALQFINANLLQYQNTTTLIDKLVDTHQLVTSVPIKLQTLAEKKFIIKNFKECMTWYNQWVDENSYGTKFNEDDLSNLADVEESFLTELIDPTKLIS